MSLPEKIKNKILFGIFVLLCALFVFSLFKQLSYPLLWNDEAETAMFAERILDYGYPKIYDGKNTLYLFEIPGKIAWDKRTGAYIGSNWGQYYFSTPGAILAHKVDDIYTKTLLLRIPFATLGLAGLVVMALSVIRLFGNRPNNKIPFLALFTLFELISVPLVLHLREVRYYSLLIFLLACLFYCYINYKFFGAIGPFSYIALTMLLLFFLFNTFSPAYFIFASTVVLYESFGLLKKIRIRLKNFIINIAPFIFSFILIVPLLIFFKTFDISAGWVRFARGCCAPYYARIFGILDFFRNYDFLLLAVAVKGILVSLLFFRRPEADRRFQISDFLTLFFVIYIFAIAGMPLPILFQRYYIAVQPILILILLIDLFAVFEIISTIKSADLKKRLKILFAFSITAIFLLSGINKIEPIKGHFYELFHRYRGSLDFAIPYIKSTYKNTERLIIATNYEEPAYMYYLGSKTIIGFVGNNLKEDIKLQPDIIIPRKGRLQGRERLFDSLLQKGHYRKISFPVFDYYPVNNIPEIDHGRFSHLYGTLPARNEDERLDIYVKQ